MATDKLIQELILKGYSPYIKDNLFFDMVRLEGEIELARVHRNRPVVQNVFNLPLRIFLGENLDPPDYISRDFRVLYPYKADLFQELFLEAFTYLMGDTPFLDDALFELNELELIIKSFKVASPKAPITLFYVDGFSPGGDRHFFYPTSNVKHNSNFVLNEYRRCLQLDGSISPLVFVCSCNTDQNGYPSHWTHEEKSATLVNPKLNLVYRKGTCGILANTGEIVVSPSLI